MKVSIVIPAYNASQFIEQTLDSVRAQSFTDWECVIVDDGSRDTTYEHCRALTSGDARFKLVSQENGGVANARNRGFEESSRDSEYVIFLDHDDHWPEDSLGILVSAADSDPDSGGAHGLALACDLRGQAVNVVEPHIKNRERKKPMGKKLLKADYSEPTTHQILLWDNVITTTGAALFRRTLLEKMPLFDQSIAPLDDWDMYFRVALVSPFVFVNKVVVHWQLHASNTSNNKHLMNSATCAFRQKMMRMCDERTEIDQTLIKKRFRRMYRSEFRHSAIDHFELAMSCLKRSTGLPQASAELANAVKCYVQYLGLHIFWAKKLYFKPVPVRYRDCRTLETAGKAG